MEKLLENKTALVAGAAGDIGRITVQRLVLEGVTSIILTDRQAEFERLEKLREEVFNMGCSVLTFPANLTDAYEVGRLMEAIADTSMGTPDIAINCAGIIRWSPLREMTDEDWREVIEVNLTGTFMFCRAVSRIMVEAGKGGRIVNITSGLAVRPTAEVGAYAASKAGVVALSKSLALELAPYNILVNCVAPGMVETRFIEGKRNRSEIEAYASRTPLGRVAYPDDVADTIIYLCGPQSRFLTGQTIYLNGGGLMV